MPAAYWLPAPPVCGWCWMYCPHPQHWHCFPRLISMEPHFIPVPHHTSYQDVNHIPSKVAKPKPNQKETKKHYQKSQINKQKQNKNIQCTHVKESSVPPLNQSIKYIGSFRGLTFPLRRSITYYSCSRNNLLMSCLQKKYSLPPLSRKERQQRHG